MGLKYDLRKVKNVVIEQNGFKATVYCTIYEVMICFRKYDHEMKMYRRMYDLKTSSRILKERHNFIKREISEFIKKYNIKGYVV